MTTLTVGALARQTGLTVRTLHHYDQIGLLKPSARSDAGYRLYRREDVARLHAIQALRETGLSLSAIAAVLDGGGPPPASIVADQIASIDRDIEAARELRCRLVLLQTAMCPGSEPELEHWLSALRQMRVYRQHFSVAELERIFGDWRATEPDWRALLPDIRVAMARQWPPDHPDTQRLAARWMQLAMRWMRGDMAQAIRWGEMIRRAAHQGFGGIDPSMIDYMEAAVDLRMAALLRHFTPDELVRLDKRLDPEWQALACRGRALMADGENPLSPRCRALLRDWDALVDRTVGHDAALRDKFLRAYRDEPLLQVGHMVDGSLRAFVDTIRAASATGRTGA